MPHFQIKFFDSIVARSRKELHSEGMISDLDTAELRARALLPALRKKLGVTGYRIEDLTGRTVAMGP